jgi:hypothetical protein
MGKTQPLHDNLLGGQNSLFRWRTRKYDAVLFVKHNIGIDMNNEQTDVWS